MTCDHDRGFDLMDRCRSCGYQLSEADLREREDAQLRDLRLGRHDTGPAPSEEAISEALF